jgi:hypothetical protein
MDTMLHDVERTETDHTTSLDAIEQALKNHLSESNNARECPFRSSPKSSAWATRN